MTGITRFGSTVLVLAALTAACEGGTGPTERAPLALSFAVQSQAGLAGSLVPFSDVQITDGTHTLDIEQAFVQFSSIEIERADGGSDVDSDGDTDSDSDSDGSHDEFIRLNGGTIELPLEGGVITPISEPLPAGFYDELELDVTTLRLVGTFDGEAFDVTLPVLLDLELEFEPPIQLVEGEPFNVTVNIDAASWFRASDGTIIDPRLVNIDSTARAAFRHRLALAFKAFEDSDRDGDDRDSDSDSH
ncbi:MAG TPA: hypothetical protein VFZ24_00205 [Longimicrobiales bacterium]